MTILHLSPGLRPGSISQLAADLACGLQEAGFTNTVASPPNELTGVLTASGVKHRAVSKVTLANVLRETARFREILAEALPQVVFAYTPEAIRVAWWAARKMPQENRPAIVAVLTGFPKGLLWTRALKHCDAIVSISKYLRNEITSHFTLPRIRGIWSIPYGVHERLCNRDYTPTPEWKEQWRRAYPPAKNVLNICVPCPISPVHGLEDLAPLLNALKRNGIVVHAYIAGDTTHADQHYLVSLQKKFEQEKVAEHITWLGLRPDLRDVLAICDVSISLARNPASHDRAVLEALALGRPVAGYDHGAVGEILDAFLPEGRVKPGDVAAMADTLTQWHALPPDPTPTIPYPYRFTDTIRSFVDLCKALKEK